MKIPPYENQYMPLAPVLCLGGSAMDLHKLKEWMEMAQKVQGGDFWNQIFDHDYAKQFMADASTENPSEGKKENSPAVDYPAIDILESDDQVFILVDIPGVQKEDVRLSLQGDRLVIRCIINSPAYGLKPIQKERKYGNFERVLKLPELPMDYKLNAKFQNGLLEISYYKYLKNEEYISID